MTRLLPKFSIVFSSFLLLMGCGATALVSTPIENIDDTPLKISDLTEAEKEHWGHLDLVADTIPGMSVDKAYSEIIKNKKGDKVIVAVLDSGIDLEHEDLDNVLWTNKGEKPGNGKDDDDNGYVDDIHGYNFLGNSYNEQLEAARIVRLKLGDADTQAKAKALVEKKYTEAQQQLQQYERIEQVIKGADEAVKKELGKDDYTKEDLAGIKANDATMQQNVAILTQMLANGESTKEVLEQVGKGVQYFKEQIEYNYNVNFDGRKEVGDDAYDLNDLGYGDGNPQSRSEDEEHGTHVAGIIAAERNNGKGVDGVANNVEIMSIRAVPNGDEYDKDIALGIRYAVDNGAKIINCSFGKSFSPKAQWVYDAIKYAADNDVLIVHAAGNDGVDLDNPDNPSYPNDTENSATEFADNVIEVGAIDPAYGSEMVAAFSNYGNKNVDIFAPGGEIYSSVPGNEYEFNGGTSMAAPAVAGVAALVRSYYPKLTAAQVKEIIIESGLAPKAKVILGGDTSKTATLDQISKSGKIANAYNALILASKVAAGDVTL